MRQHASTLPHRCDVCGTWRGPTLHSLRAHKALHCTRTLAHEGAPQEITTIVDDATTTSGQYYRVKWKADPEDSWEPEWELLGDDACPGTAPIAVKRYWEAVQKGTHTAPPKGGNCVPHCPGGPFQCTHCCWWSRSDLGRKIHEARCPQGPKQRGTASLTAHALRTTRRSRVVNKLPPVTSYKRVKEEWQPCALAHCAQFKYLGCMVEGGPRTLAEITHRISQARIKLQVH